MNPISHKLDSQSCICLNSKYCLESHSAPRFIKKCVYFESNYTFRFFLLQPKHPLLISTSTPTRFSASNFSHSLQLQGRIVSGLHETTMASPQLLELSPVARPREDGTRAPQYCIAPSTTTCGKRSEPVTSCRSAVQHWITFTQVAYNLDDAPPANPVAKFGGFPEDAPCFPPQLSYGEPPHKCLTDPCKVCGYGTPKKPSQRVA